MSMTLWGKRTQDPRRLVPGPVTRRLKGSHLHPHNPQRLGTSESELAFWGESILVQTPASYLVSIYKTQSTTPTLGG